MNRLLLYPYSLICLLLLLLLHASKAIDIWAAQDLEGEEREEFIKDCQTNSTCGGIQITYPFRLINSTPAYCGVQGFEVSCSAAGDAIITLPHLGLCKIIHLDTYASVRIKLLGDEWAQYPLHKLSSTNLTGSIYQLESYYSYYSYSYSDTNYTLMNCSSEIATNPDWITGPIPCLGNGSTEGQLVYAADASVSMDRLPSGCVGTGIGGGIGYTGERTFEDLVQGFIQTLRMDLSLNIPEWEMCRDCHIEGKQCGFSRRRNQTACLTRANLEGEEREEFIKDCQTNSTCGGIDITYPFRLINSSTPAYCGVQGFEVSCSAAGDAIITLPLLGLCKITHLYPYSSVRIKLLGDEWAQCPLHKLSSTNLTGSIYRLESEYDYYNEYSYNYMLMNCSSEIATDPDWITGPIPCLRDGSQRQWVYAADARAPMDQFPSGCVGTGIGGWIGYTGEPITFGDLVQGFNQMLQMDVYLNIPEWEMCIDCHREGKQCGFSSRRSQTACLTRSYPNLEKEEREEFIKDCQNNSTCGGIQITYPFRLLNSTPEYCGVQGLEVSCSAASDAIITLPRLGPCKIIKFDNDSVRIKVEGDEWAQCPLRKLSSTNLTGSIYDDDYSNNYILVNCSSEIATDPDWITGPIPCLGINGSQGEWVYVAKVRPSMDQLLPSGCLSTGIGGHIKCAGGRTFGDLVQGFIQTLEMDLPLMNIPEWDMCRDCYREGKQCGYSSRRNQTACFISARHHGTNIELIIGTCIGGLVVVLTSLIILYMLKKKSEKDQEIRFKVEQFLATYGDAQPTRYSFSDIRKITMRFKNKLGQGGYGSVYKGELPNGIPVAVKMLESSIGEGQEFTNEVATIGRIHHINVTRLLGFCSDRSTRALIYEFMPNESLEKYIFSSQDKGSNKSLSVEKLSNIAIGIARGIEYLHQGCEQRILHFDIKPHNILLDYDLNPKISDFGLAKLCSRDISIVTMTAARGTMGYIAPEMYCRNFGTVSYKSDVYSFGMLLLEMIGGRKNHDPEIGRESEIYYPEWVYDRLVERQDLVLAMEIEQNDGEILQKLSKVALWCIQWSPTERPTMTRVLHMLIGSSEEVPMPPKPFVSQH